MDKLSEEEKLRKNLRNAIAQYRISVRWLRDAKAYKTAYSGELTFNGETWKEGKEGALGKDAIIAYSEAINGVLHWRGRVDMLNKELMDLASRKKNNERL